MSHAPDLSMPHTGDILGGRYILRERIGAGGMGRVFRARDEVLARDVAIKIFHADGTGEPEPLRRLSEARALAALDHPSLVTLYDARLVGEGHVYLVMELVTGPSLQRRIEQRAIPAAELAGILSDLAGALAVVHEAGIVHRDVKPSNVLLRPLHGAARESEAVLADFGVAHLIDATRLTTPGTVIGTAAYLAPEQVRGEAPQAASDIYALGLLAIEALTRLHPFGAGSLQETLLARLARQPDVPNSVGPRWRSLLDAMTAADAGMRPTAAEVAACATALAAEDHTVVPDAAKQPPVWMLPTALITAPTATPDDASTPSTAVQDALGAAASGAPEPADTVLVSAPSDAARLAGRTDAASSRRGTGRRPRRRGWAWGAASIGAALIVGGHLAAFSLGAAGGATSDPAPVPVMTPAPAATPATGSTQDTPLDTAAPVSETSPAEDVVAERSPEATTPVQAPVSVERATVVWDDAGVGAETVPANPADRLPEAVAGNGSDPGGVADGTSAGPGRRDAEGKGRPDSPGKSDDSKGRGDGASGKN
ncbi:serine/threonine-protein kinase [Microbacterium proteolyticum]|uniref:serine/threonine-protein kinase n=1 Tax=Microbacterium proteolyticum TaxID=1572644 RepID=UPI001FACE349|nr:serine/threonine-protein kinase [Microbacterium proteolyticum]MCI9856857.1 protein kinase [Microbacterium proteolyticum]